MIIQRTHLADFAMFFAKFAKSAITNWLAQKMISCTARDHWMALLGQPDIQISDFRFSFLLSQNTISIMVKNNITNIQWLFKFLEWSGTIGSTNFNFSYI